MVATVVSAAAAVTALKANETSIGTTAPASPFTGQLWIDTSGNLYPPPAKRYNGSTWDVIGTKAGVNPTNQGRIFARDFAASDSSNVDNTVLGTISGLSIPTSQPFELIICYAPGDNTNFRLGLSINGTTVNSTAAAPIDKYNGTTTTQNVQMCRLYFPRRDVNVTGQCAIACGRGGPLSIGVTAVVPNATITSIGILCKSGTSAITLGKVMLVPRS